MVMSLKFGAAAVPVGSTSSTLPVLVGVGRVPVDQRDPATRGRSVAPVLGVPADQDELVPVVVAAVGGADGVPAAGDALRVVGAVPVVTRVEGESTVVAGD